MGENPEGMTPEERSRVAAGLYRSARKRGATAIDLRGLIKLRTGKTRTRDLSDDELLALRDEVVRLPAITKAKRIPSETAEEWQKRRRKEKLA